MVEDRASCGNYSPRFGSGFIDTDLDEDGELAPRRHRDVTVAVLHVSRGHPSLWYWMIWFTKCTDTPLARLRAQRGYAVLLAVVVRRAHVGDVEVAGVLGAHVDAGERVVGERCERVAGVVRSGPL